MAEKKLYSLTDEHRAILNGPWKEKWVSSALSTEIMTESERSGVECAIKKLYTNANLAEPKAVVFCESSLSGVIASGIAAGIWYLRQNPEVHVKLFGRKIGESELSASIYPAARFCVSAGMDFHRTLQPATAAATVDAAATARAAAAADAATARAADAATAATAAATSATSATARAADAATAADDAAATARAARAATARAAAAGTVDAAATAATAAAADAARAAVDAADTVAAAAARAADAAADAAAATTATAATADAAATARAADAATAATARAADAATVDAADAAAAADAADARATAAAATAAADDPLLVRFYAYCASRAGWRMRNWGNLSIWYPFYLSFFRQVAKLDIDWAKWEPYEFCSEHSGPRYTHEKFTIVCERPSTIRTDAEKRPHCADGPSFMWRDGWDLYHWHGVQVPKAWITDTANMDPVIALTWPNIEQRRAAAEIIGWARVIEQLKPRVIDTDANPQYGQLLEVDLPGAGLERFLRVRCATGRDFCLPVPRGMKTAIEANARTFRITVEQLRQSEGRT